MSTAQIFVSLSLFPIPFCFLVPPGCQWCSYLQITSLGQHRNHQSLSIHSEGFLQNSVISRLNDSSHENFSLATRLMVNIRLIELLESSDHLNCFGLEIFPVFCFNLMIIFGYFNHAFFTSSPPRVYIFCKPKESSFGKFKQFSELV